MKMRIATRAQSAAVGLHSCRFAWNHLLEEFGSDGDVARKGRAISSNLDAGGDEICGRKYNECHPRYRKIEQPVAHDLDPDALSNARHRAVVSLFWHQTNNSAPSAMSVYSGSLSHVRCRYAALSGP